MKRIPSLLALVAVSLSTLAALAEAPTRIAYYASNPCRITTTGIVITETVLETAESAPDGETWYAGSGNRILDTGPLTSADAPVVGYETAWYTYPTNRTSATLAQQGPRYATALVATGSHLDFASVADKIFMDWWEYPFLYLVVTPHTYHVNVDLYDGSAIPRAEIAAETSFDTTFGQVFSLPVPTREGYVFTGWQLLGTSPDYETARWGTAEDDVSEPFPEGSVVGAEADGRHYFKNLTANNAGSVTLRANWTKRQYALELVVGTGVKTIWYHYGAEEAYIPVTETTSVKLDNGTSWSAYVDCTEHYEMTGAGSSRENPKTGVIAPPGDVYEPKPTGRAYGVAIACDPPEGGTASGAGAYSYGTNAILRATPAANWRFARWSDGATENPHAITVLSPTNLTVSFTQKADWRVRFDGNGATSGTMDDQLFVVEAEQALTPNAYVRTGFIFAGWSEEPAAARATYADGATVKDLLTTRGGILTLYAVWTPGTYTIRYDYNDGTRAARDVRVGYTDAVALPEAGGSSFRYWASGTASYAVGETVTRLADADGVVTMTAVRSTTGQITFDAHGGTGGMAALALQENVEAALPACGFARTGYAFAGWSKTAGGSVAYADRALVSVADAGTLYAVWSPIRYELSFEPINASGIRAATNLCYGESVEISTDGFTPQGGEGWSFVGWSTSKTGEGDVSKDPTCTVSNLTTHAGDHVRLFACWKLTDPGDFSKALGCDNLRWEENDEFSICTLEGGEKEVRNDKSGVVGSFAELWTDVDSPGVLKFYARSWESELSKIIIVIKVENQEQQIEEISKVPHELKEINCVVRSKGKLYLRFDAEEEFRCAIRNLTWTPSMDGKSVTFDLGAHGTRLAGGETQQTVEAGHAAWQPTVSAAAGWTFVGWDKSNELENVTQDLDVKALYEQTVYRIVYANARGNTNPNPTSRTADKAVTFAVLDAKGFKGWSPAAIAADTAADVVVTALWEEDAPTESCTVTYEPGEHGAFADEAAKISVSVGLGKNAVWPSVTAEAGWQFLGWGTAADQVGCDKTIVARYAAIPYPITYASTKDVANANPVTYTVEDAFAFVALEDVADYEFVGWSPTEIRLGTTGRQTATAVWKAVTPGPSPEPVVSNVVQFVLGNWGVRTGGGALTQRVAYGDAAVAPDVSPKSGWAFTGWDTDAYTYVTEDLVVNALYEEVEEPVPTTRVSVAYDESLGTVKGAGDYVTGKRVTLRATALRGNVFSGWFASDGSLLATKTSYTFQKPAAAVSLAARFATKEEDYDALSVKVNALAFDAWDAAVTNVPVGVYLVWPVAATSTLSTASVTVSGLPSGLKFTAKALVDKTKGRSIPANSIYGAPTVAKTATVKLTVKSSAGTTRKFTLSVTTEALPTELVGTYLGGSTNETAAGSATLTVAKSGAVSGKWISQGKTWTVKAPSFDAGDPESGRYRTSATFKNGSTTFTQDLDVCLSPVAPGAYHEAAENVAAASCELFSAAYTNWKVEPWKEIALAFRNETFTVSAGDGDTITCKIGSSGSVTAKGSFDVGKTRPYAPSVTTKLTACGGDTYACLVYFAPKASSAFPGYTALISVPLDSDGE